MRPYCYLIWCMSTRSEESNIVSYQISPSVFATWHSGNPALPLSSWWCSQIARSAWKMAAGASGSPFLMWWICELGASLGLSASWWLSIGSGAASAWQRIALNTSSTHHTQVKNPRSRRPYNWSLVVAREGLKLTSGVQNCRAHTWILCWGNCF
jgi:hypothetical protein